ncbi:hypothetical protein, partial [Nocardia veterana]|uniref:hypothetical protein n=1 Tax=Nocardia veterana TaxID=132249 RepID=UPI001B349EE8
MVRPAPDRAAAIELEGHRPYAPVSGGRSGNESSSHDESRRVTVRLGSVLKVVSDGCRCVAPVRSIVVNDAACVGVSVLYEEEVSGR